MLGAGLALHGVAERGPKGAACATPAQPAPAGMGGMLARCAALLGTSRVRNGAAIMGLACVVAGFVVLRPGVGFPAPFALLPAGGTALLIWAGAGA